MPFDSSHVERLLRGVSVYDQSVTPPHGMLLRCESHTNGVQNQLECDEHTTNMDNR